MSILKKVTKSQAGKKYSAMLLGKFVNEEIKHLCSDNFNSIIRENSKTGMEHFSWQSVWLELEKHAPLLITVLKPALKIITTDKVIILIMLICMLLKSRNPKMDYLQSMISLILYAGHAGKQVCSANNFCWLKSQ